MEEYQMKIMGQGKRDFSEIMLKEIEYLKLSTRSENALQMADVKTIGQLTGMTRTELYRIPNIGSSSVDEIGEALLTYNLSLGMNSKAISKQKTLLSDLNNDLLFKIKEAFEKTSRNLLEKEQWKKEEVYVALSEHKKILKLYEEQLYNCFNR
jgi:hypothetical protein